MNILSQQPEDRLPSFFPQVKLSIRQKTQQHWLIPDKAFKTNSGAHSLMMRDIGFNQTRQIMFIWLLNQAEIIVHSISQHMAVRIKACEEGGEA